MLAQRRKLDQTKRRRKRSEAVPNLHPARRETGLGVETGVVEVEVDLGE